MKVRSAFYHYIYVLLFVAIGLLVCLSGCTTCINPEKSIPRFVIVLVDETDSVGFYKDGKLQYLYWPEFIPWVAKIAEKLSPSDAFCVIGIDDHGFDDDDIRIPITTLDENTLKAVIQKKSLVRNIKALTRRQEKYKATDITGALSQAAYLLQKDPSRKSEIVIFSDMIQEPLAPTPKSVKNLNFPNGTELNCFYVSASGRDKWETVVDTWVKVLQSTGLDVSIKNFHQRGEMSLQFNNVFGNWGDTRG